MEGMGMGKGDGKVRTERWKTRQVLHPECLDAFPANGGSILSETIQLPIYVVLWPNHSSILMMFSSSNPFSEKRND